MIWFTLSLLSLAIFSNFAEAEDPDSAFLLYAVKKGNSVKLYVNDFKLSKPNNFHNLTKKHKTLGNIFVGEGHVYLSFENSNVVGRYDMANDKYDQKPIGEGTYTLVGIGQNDELYLFDSNERGFIVYNFGDATPKSELMKLKQANKKMPSIDVDPREKRRYIFYAYCKVNSTPVGKVFDVTNNELFKNYNQELPKCFDMWRITPDGAQAYAVKANEIYFTPEEGKEFVLYYSDKSRITAFALGNTELFYTPAKGRKIIKVVKKSDKGQKDIELKVDGKVIAMTLSEPSKFNTTPVLETKN